MTTRRLRFLAVSSVLAMILFTGSQPVMAQPTGEIKILASMLGGENPIPRHASIHALDVWGLLYDHLVGSTPDGRLSTQHSLAEKWEMTPDALTWTFTLRKGVRFHNGDELTAKDVKFSLEQVIRPDSQSGQAGYLRSTIQNMEVKGPYTIAIKSKNRSLFFHEMLSNILACDGMIIPKDYYERVGEDGFFKHPIGSGPYKFHSQVVGSYIKLEATDRHWRDGVPRFKYLTYMIIPEESTQVAMLKTGEGDIARISRDRVKETLDAGLKIVKKDNAAVILLHTNMQWTSPVFSDIRFRKALNLAIDKEAIIKHILAGMGAPFAEYPGKNALTCGGDTALKPYPYAPDEARRLIKEGGYEGHEFTMVTYPRSGLPEYPRIVEAVVGYWQKIGLKPKIQMTDWATWRERWDARKTQNTAQGYDDTSNPVCGSIVERNRSKFYSKSTRAICAIPALDERFEKILNSVDLTEVSRLMGEISRYVYDQYIIIPICEIPDVIATTKKVPEWNPGSRRNDRNFSDLIRQR